MFLNFRQEKILLALIEEFIDTAEPVGSSTLLNKHNLDCSSATIRNEMAYLESLGFLGQPHSSSGRIPLDEAYRFYVKYLLQKGILPPPEALDIQKEYQDETLELESLIEHTRKILAQLTNYTSLILGPRINKTIFKYLKLIFLNPHSVLVIMLTNTGGIIHRVINLDSEINPYELDKMAKILNDRLQGKSLEIFNFNFLRQFSDKIDLNILNGLSEIAKNLFKEVEKKIFYDGTINLLNLPEFKDLKKLKLILEVLEDEKLVAEILSESLSSQGLQVSIGSENQYLPMESCSLISAAYNVDGEPVGSLGILGPKRMPYERIISIVKYVAQSFSERLNKLKL
ncbi:MAG: heat-inducible transcription repressor HrcA [Armatimonadetes bacterium]|nr:heat-inducible transcription repressor HrcA [Armatimonadota bacterium]